jgi:hypothetical protein
MGLVMRLSSKNRAGREILRFSRRLPLCRPCPRWPGQKEAREDREQETGKRLPDEV